ncbi:alpha/beta hydrolase [Aeromonas veronii]|nr:alpha/beta hydrolase [Aeromonas veronii]OEC55838.1 alpha/beta hydrolase [Aeromonas sp. ANNP30]OEC65660.1 alpha/beta hydrolase [Aeromonas sp. ANP5]KRV73359.1 alpha/beta hydrolase [Aeromonas veronii]KRV83456.1 alpha/beta hydrolase [Aeromonas veronii]
MFYSVKLYVFINQEKRKMKLKTISAFMFGLSAIASFNSFADINYELQPGINKVNFLSENTRISGNLFLPKDFNPAKKYPAIVVITPASGVKEQTAGIYAKKMAEKGYVTLAFDHRTYGESGGMPRGMENAPMKVEDIKNAISFIRSIPGVDDERVAELGLCSGAGYGLQTAYQDSRVKSLAVVSAFIDFTDYGMGGATQYANMLNGSPVKQYQQQIKWASDARQKYFETGEVLYVDGIPAAGSGLGEFWDQAADYYRNSKRGGAVATYTPKRAAISLDSRYAFNPTEHIELLEGKPFMAIIGSEALSAPFSKIAVERAKQKKIDATLFTIKGAGHFDLYDQDKYVNQAVIKLDEFYKKTIF